LLFIGSVVAGAIAWAVFAAFDTEPWDEPAGWAAMALLGLAFGFVGQGKPLLWPLGILIGGALFGTAAFLRDVFFYSGGGANLFFPLGLIFLVPFTLPALIGSFVGAEIRKATRRVR
jgi:hypothetical protein